MAQQTFIIDCPFCEAKVAAIEKGSASISDFDEESGWPAGKKLIIGQCPRCGELLVGQTHQISVAGIDNEEDEWSNVVVRVYPKPPKTFVSNRIPRSVTESLSEADRSLQASANIAACVMFGRALEAVCRDFLDPKLPSGTAEAEAPPKRRILLGEGIKMLKDKGIIDDRLYDWSQQLHAFRNLAAHPGEISISRQDAEDLQSFVYAIIEYIYDLADRYEEFKARIAKKK